jgi:hypothetical protein
VATPAEAVLSRWWWAKWWLKRNYKQLVASLVIIALLAWWLWPKLPPPEWPRIKGPIITFTSRRGYLAVPLGKESGIERICLMPTGYYDPSEDLRRQDVLATIGSSNQEVRIPPGSVFDLVVVVKAVAPEFLAYASKENLGVALSASGSFLIPLEYAPDDQEHVFEEENYGETPGYIRVNVVWDNYGEGYELHEHGFLHIRELRWQAFKAQQ